MMVVREMGEFDTLDFCNTLNIDKSTYLMLEADMKDRRKNPGYSSYTPQLFKSIRMRWNRTPTMLEVILLENRVLKRHMKKTSEEKKEWKSG